MAVCKKTSTELFVGTLTLIGIIVGSVFTITGVNSRNAKQNANVADEVYVSLGSLITLVASAVVVGMLIYKTEIGASQLILLLGVFVSSVLELYTVNYITTTPADTVTYIVMAFGFLFRIVTLMVGYGRCEIADVIPQVISDTVGGKR